MAYVEGACRGARGGACAEGWDMGKEMYKMAQTIQIMSITMNEALQTIKELQQYVYDQLGTPASLITENPKQKSDLEISNQIAVNDEFLNLKIDN